MAGRCDYAIILARGASSRMGKPKGLLRCPGNSGQTFLQAIATIYNTLNIPVLVVTTAGLVKSYEEQLGLGFSGLVLGCADGGETGLTLKYGWEATGSRATHLWAHPVDLPLVKTATLVQIRSHSEACPDDLVRPQYAGDPGHPVVVPVAGLAGLAENEVWQQAPMRDVITLALRSGHIARSIDLPVKDPGVVTDFDSPADFEHFGGTTEKDSDGPAQ